jgi:hypothetical protein
MRRLLTGAAVAVALSIPASVAAVGVVSSAPAFASSSITCTSLKGTITGTVTIGKCTPSGGKGYKSASAPASSLASGGTLTWTKSGATTTVSLSVTSPGQGGCKKGYVEEDATGSVTAASTTGAGIPAVGDATSARACADISNGKITLVKGSTFSL